MSFELCCRYQKYHQMEEVYCKYVNCKDVDPRPVETRSLMILILVTSSLTHQKNIHELITHSQCSPYPVSENLFWEGIQEFGPFKH